MTNFETETLYVNEKLLLGNSDVRITMFYPEEVKPNQALTGVVAPALGDKYPFKVRVSKVRKQWLWRVLLMERDAEDLHHYHVIESYKALTEKHAMSKARRVIRRGINMMGVK